MTTRGVDDMTDSEVTDFIKQCPCGVVSVLDDDKPYSVVLEHYFDGNNFYFLCSKGEEHRKIRSLRKNPDATFMMYQSRRETPDMVKQHIKCRSVLVEGKLSELGLRQIKSKEFGSVSLKVLKLEPKVISNWQCPSKRCDWNMRWYDRYPDLVASLE